MNWTKEIPTVDGWYWIKDGNHLWIDEVRRSCIYSYELGSRGQWVNVTFSDYEFYGPLEEPK